MKTTRLFRSKGLQNLRLPEDVAFPEGVTELAIRREGACLILSPVGASWDDFFNSPGIDLPEREQPGPQGREALFGNADVRVGPVATRA